MFWYIEIGKQVAMEKLIDRNAQMSQTIDPLVFKLRVVPKFSLANMYWSNLNIPRTTRVPAALE